MLLTVGALGPSPGLVRQHCSREEPSDRALAWSASTAPARSPRTEPRLGPPALLPRGALGPSPGLVRPERKARSLSAAFWTKPHGQDAARSGPVKAPDESIRRRCRPNKSKEKRCAPEAENDCETFA